MEKIIIIGSSGFLGTALATKASQNCSLIATYRNSPCKVTKSNIEQLLVDFEDGATVREIEQKIGNNDIVILASNVEYGEQSERTIERYQHFLRFLVVRHIKSVFISSDAIFDGRQNCYSEDSVPNPMTEYGKRKLESEKIIDNGCNLIIRTSYLYGFNGYSVDKRLKELVKASSQGITVNRFKGFIRNPIHVQDLAQVILQLLDKNGVFHVAGPPVSAFDFAIRLKEETGINVRISEVEPNEHEIANIPMNTNLISLRLSSLGIEIPSLEDHRGKMYLG